MAVTVRSLGKPFPEVYIDGELVAEGHAIEWEKYHHDGVIVDVGTHAAAQAIGCEVDYPEDEIPRVRHRAVESLERIDELTLPDPQTTFPLTVMIEAVTILKQEIGKHAMVIATVDQGPFTLSSQILGMETFLMILALGDSEELVFKLLAFCRDFTFSYGKALHAAGADIIRMGDSVSGPDMISPEMYERYAFPFQRSLSRAFKDEGIPFDFHICGNATPILHKMVETGAVYVEIDEKTDLSKAMEAVGERGGINGTISPQLLRFGTTEEVEEACREVLQSWLPRPGLFFGPGCTLSPDTPESNIRALIHCAEVYGRYE
jgi:MtaA/CmuA family methyltransferase